MLPSYKIHAVLKRHSWIVVIIKHIILIMDDDDNDLFNDKHSRGYR